MYSLENSIDQFVHFGDNCDMETCTRDDTVTEQFLYLYDTKHNCEFKFVKFDSECGFIPDLSHRLYGAVDTCVENEFEQKYDPITDPPLQQPSSTDTFLSYTPSYWEQEYVYAYLSDASWSSEVICKLRRYDNLVLAVFTVMLSWNSYDQFDKVYSSPKTPVHILTEYLKYAKENGIAPAHPSNPSYRVLPSAFKILAEYFQSIEQNGDHGQDMEKPLFNFRSYLSSSFVKHLFYVYNCLQRESWDFARVRDEYASLEAPFARFSPPDSVYKPKYITGVACVGKSTLLTTLAQRDGWKIYSRRDLGSFGGKSKSAAQIAGLHASFEVVLRRHDSIGDRGPIDNPLWSAIMPLCRGDTNLVTAFLSFFESTFNELVAEYHAGFDVVVIVDPYPSCNRKRMLKRNTNGDALRARVPNYVVTQFVGYYIFAALFAFPVYFVPYTSICKGCEKEARSQCEHGALRMDRQRMWTELVEPVSAHFKDNPFYNQREQSEIKETSRVSENVPDFMLDNAYEKIIGIYK